MRLLFSWLIINLLEVQIDCFVPLDLKLVLGKGQVQSLWVVFVTLLAQGRQCR